MWGAGFVQQARSDFEQREFYCIKFVIFATPLHFMVTAKASVIFFCYVARRQFNITQSSSYNFRRLYFTVFCSIKTHFRWFYLFSLSLLLCFSDLDVFAWCSPKVWVENTTILKFSNHVIYITLGTPVCFIIIRLVPRAGKMNRISRCDWLPERARWNYPARSGYGLCPASIIYHVLVSYPI